jgi:hypothetical protein
MNTPYSSWLCPVCQSDAVAIADSQERGPGHVALLLRCGECHTLRDIFMTRMLAERFTEHLEIGMSAIAAAVEQLALGEIDAY